MSKKATSIDFFGLKTVSMRTFHRAWTAFFSCFHAWLRIDAAAAALLMKSAGAIRAVAVRTAPKNHEQDAAALTSPYIIV